MRVLAALLVLAPGVALAAPLYTAAQADLGAGFYAKDWARCHGADLRRLSGPPLVGPAFAARRARYTMGAVFTEVWEGTPAGAPDSLGQSVYADVMAYLVASNGY